MKKLAIEELRKFQLELLITVDEFCQANGLRYSLGGGTLLGAVRHQGYIPWDDDIDIMMPRPDYERFLKEFPASRPDLICDCYELNEACHHPFMKLCIPNTRQVTPDLDQESMINIDVFPIDGLPSPQQELAKFISNVTILRQMVVAKKLKLKYYHGLFSKCRVLVVRSLFSLSYLQQRLKREVMSYDFEQSHYAGAILGAYGAKEVHKQSVFTTYTTLPFEERRFQVIAEYDLYLKQHYGDYMQLPPEDKRINHGAEAWVLEQGQ